MQFILLHRPYLNSCVALCQVLCMFLVGCGGGQGQRAGLISFSSVFPARGSAAGGGRIKVSGQGFSSDIRVRIGGQPCEEVIVLDASSLTCVVPPHEPGAFDIQVISSEGAQARASNAYVYRPTGIGILSFGILTAVPSQAVYSLPFSKKLESVIAGFDQTTMTRSWLVNGKIHDEGDVVLFDVGSHTVSLTVRDATGDSDQVSYSVIVGQLTELSEQATENSVSEASQGVGKKFMLSPGKSISLMNTGFLPLINPRFIGAGKPDYIDWARYLNSLTQISSLPTDASESSRERLLEAAWKDLSNMTVHVCSPGRETEDINDPVLLIRGYGYECCSNASRALAYLGSFLDIPSRVRSTWSHEFPEFTIRGNTFILDPDLRLRFWSTNGLPLSAWTTDSTPVSLMNVDQYFVETVMGEKYEVQAGGALPIGDSTSENLIRPHYLKNIASENIWGYREAFSGSSYILYPGERIAFDRTSTYVPLQRLKGDGTPTGDGYAPAVGKVVFRRIWSAGGTRDFSQDRSGNRVILLNDLPYPTQDLIFYFSKPVDPSGFWLTSAGEIYKIGSFTANTWTVSSKQLRIFGNLSDLAAVVPQNQDLVAVDVGMQFNPSIFGAANDTVTLGYSDDSGLCQRKLRVMTNSDMGDVNIGARLCENWVPQRVEASHGLSLGQPGVNMISSYGNSYQGVWGLTTAAGVQGTAEISLPRTPGLTGTLRAINEGLFADWYIYDGEQWKSLNTTDVSISQWIKLPATSSSITRLRVRLRQAPATESTYLSYLSLIEGREMNNSPFVDSSTGPNRP